MYCIECFVQFLFCLTFIVYSLLASHMSLHDCSFNFFVGFNWDFCFVISKDPTFVITCSKLSYASIDNKQSNGSRR